jgi:fibronectin type 3 domain-containing protein
MNHFKAFRRLAVIAVTQILCALHLHAQTAPNAQNGFGGIVIFTSSKIVAPSTPNPSGTLGFNIYRKSKADAVWKKLNTKPVQRSQDKRDFEALFGADFLADLVRLGQATTPDDAWRLVQQTTDRSTSPVKALFLDPRAVVPFGEAFVDSTAELGKEYEYAIAPLSASGEGAKQPRGIAARLPPPELTLLMGCKAQSLDAKSVELRWNAISRRGTIAGYEIFRSEAIQDAASAKSATQTSMRSLALVLGSGPVYVDTTVRYGAAYTYLVVPFDAYLNKELRTDTIRHIHAVVRDLPLSQNLVATSTTAGIKLTWSLQRPPAPEFRGTIIFRALTDDMTKAREEAIYEPQDTVAYSQTEYIDRTVAPGETRYYRLKTLGVDNSTSLFSTYYGAMFEMGRDKANIPPPVNLRGVSTKAGIRLTWSPLTIMPVEGYYVYRSMSARDSLELISKVVKGTEFVDSAQHLSAYSPYYYAVATVNSSFVWGAKSERTAVRHDMNAKPDAPPTPSAYQEHGAVVVKWSNEATMNPALAGYNVYRSAPNSKPEKLTAQPLAANVTQFRDIINDAKPPVDEMLVYTITSIDAVGKESPPSPAAMVDYRLPDLRPPSSVRAVPGAKGITVRWSATTDKRVTGYEIFRTSKGGTSAIIGTVAAGVVEFIDKQIKVGEPHYYKIVALGAKGKSAPSAEVVVIP